MKLTGRLQGQSPSVGHASRDAFLATQSGEEIARQVRIDKLRRLVAAGRYQVEPDRMAAKILQRALARGQV